MRLRPSIHCFQLIVVAALVYAGALSAARAQVAVVEPTPTPPIPADATLEQLMSPAEFQAAGLKKLTGAELANLNGFLRGIRAQAEKAAVEKLIPPPSPRRTSSQPLIESRIVGTFEGLKGRSRWLLANGQVWQQSNTEDRSSGRAENPYVALVKTAFGYKMVVSGIGRPFYVRQVVLP